MQLFIFLSNACNLRCKGCPVAKEHKQSLTMEDIETIATWDYDRVALLGGEPFLVKNLDKIIDILDKPTTIYTNGTLLNEKNFIENIIYAVSIDSLNRKVNDSIRGVGVYKKVMNTIDLLMKNRDRVKEIILRATYNQRNYQDMFAMIEFCRDRNIGLALHPRIGFEKYNGKLYTGLTANQQLKLFTEIAKHDKMVVLTPHFFQWIKRKNYRCPAGEFRLSINYNGDVKPCQWGSYVIGNVRYDDFDFLKEEGIKYNREFIQKRFPSSCLHCERLSQCHGGCELVTDTKRCPLGFNIKYNISSFLDQGQVDKYKISMGKLGKMGFSGC